MTLDVQTKQNQPQEQTMEEFFRRRVAWKPGDPILEEAADFARKYIRPLLPDGMFFNLAGAAIDRETKRFTNSEALRRAKEGKEAFQRQLELYERDADNRFLVIEAILSAIFPDPATEKTSIHFDYRGNHAACRIFAQRAASKVFDLLRRWVAHHERNVELNDDFVTRSALLTGGALMTNRIDVLETLWMLPRCIEKALGERNAQRFIALTMLKKCYEYEYQEIAWMLRSPERRRDFARKWNKIRSEWRKEYPLPEWQDISVALPSAPSAKALTLIYKRVHDRFMQKYPVTPECEALER